MKIDLVFVLECGQEWIDGRFFKLWNYWRRILSKTINEWENTVLLLLFFFPQKWFTECYTNSPHKSNVVSRLGGFLEFLFEFRGLFQKKKKMKIHPNRNGDHKRMNYGQHNWFVKPKRNENFIESGAWFEKNNNKKASFQWCPFHRFLSLFSLEMCVCVWYVHIIFAYSIVYMNIFGLVWN